MHFEILVEDKSGKKMLDILVPKIIGNTHTFKVYAYKGIGHIPKNLNSGIHAKNRLLLHNLPRLLRGYGKAFSSYRTDYQAAVIVVCDLDDRSLKAFRKELFDLLNACNPRPETRFCMAIEEGEAWLLGDISAVKTAYPQARDSLLKAYVNDSICGTWELLADAIYKGGSSTLSARGWQAVGMEKILWAEKISPHMDVRQNKSRSFSHFRDSLLDLIK